MIEPIILKTVLLTLAVGVTSVTVIIMFLISELKTNEITLSIIICILGFPTSSRAVEVNNRINCSTFPSVPTAADFKIFWPSIPSEGSILKYTCHQGYYPHGTQEFSCQKDGVWQPADIKDNPAEPECLINAIENEWNEVEKSSSEHSVTNAIDENEAALHHGRTLIN